MREQLKENAGVRGRFFGSFVRYGCKRTYKGYAEETILLGEVKDSTGMVVSDHLWFTCGKSFKSLGRLVPGDVVEFEARVLPYLKGYVHGGLDERTIDYKLSHPTKIKLRK